MFSRLPFELVCIIFGQLDNLQDLYSAIRASSFTYGAFQGARHRTLLSVMRNNLRPEALMPEVRFALRAGQPDAQIERPKLSLVEIEQLCRLRHSHHYFFKDLLVYFTKNLNAQLKAMQREPMSDKMIGLSEDILFSAGICAFTALHAALLGISTYHQTSREQGQR